MRRMNQEPPKRVTWHAAPLVVIMDTIDLRNVNNAVEVLSISMNVHLGVGGQLGGRRVG